MMFDRFEQPSAEESSSNSLIHEIMDHTRTTWSHVAQGKATFGEYAEAGAETIAAAALIDVGGRALFKSGAEGMTLESMTAGKTTAEAEKCIITGPARTFEGTPIPDVVRPSLTANQILDASNVAAAGEKYRGDLQQFFALPRSVVAGPQENGASLAEKLLAQRSALTGERVVPGAIRDEMNRLHDLNPGLEHLPDWNGKTVRVYDDSSMIKIANNAMFKHVPPLGQFLKSTGKVTEAQIDEAFAYQKTLPADSPRRLLGHILEDKGYIGKADADAAFGAQAQFKAYLKNVMQETLPKPGT